MLFSRRAPRKLQSVWNSLGCNHQRIRHLGCSKKEPILRRAAGPEAPRELALAITNNIRCSSLPIDPDTVYTDPVGLTVRSQRHREAPLVGVETSPGAIFRSEFKALKHTLSGSTERTLMKLVVETKTDRVVGLHMVGAEAGEIVQGFAVAMKAGATKALFDSTIGIHPTAAEEFVTMREPVKSQPTF